MNLVTFLKERYGFDEFRPGQKEIIEAVLNGDHVLGVLATGSGKTLCYQMASQLLTGLTIVISPLISLIEDQWTRMRQKGEKKVGMLHSGLSFKQLQKEWKAIELNQRKVLLVSPERFCNPLFIKKLAEFDISLLVIDEAHCVSQWGFDFRPDYLKIKESYRFLNNPPVLALTGTAGREIQEDILEYLAIPNAKKIVLSMNRPNIAYQVIMTENEQDKKKVLLQHIPKLKGPGIIYTATRNQADQLSFWLSKQLNLEIPSYHAGMSNENRSLVQAQFLSGQVSLITATSAFGMGIDKEDIGYTIHYQIPPSIEAYIQETGRIGRDNRLGISILLYSKNDYQATASIIDYGIPTLEDIHLMIQLLEESQHPITIQDKLFDHLPLKSVIYQLQKRDWIDYTFDELTGEEILEWKKEMDTKDLQELVEEWDQYRSKKHDNLFRLHLILVQGLCIRKGILQYFEDWDHHYQIHCCSNCHIDVEYYYTFEKVESHQQASIMDWKEELQRLLPV